MADFAPYTPEQLDQAEAALQAANASSGYSQGAIWAAANGPRMIAEMRRLRMAFRINMLRHASVSHAEIDAFLNGEESLPNPQEVR